jgi:hypothetical protein
LNLEATTAVEMPVPAITGLPKPTTGVIWTSFGSFRVRSITNGLTGIPSLHFDWRSQLLNQPAIAIHILLNRRNHHRRSHAVSRFEREQTDALRSSP